MMINTNKEVWLEGLCKLGKIWWLLNSSASVQRNIESKTKVEFLELSVYWVGTRLINIDNSRLRLLATSWNISTYVEW